MLLALKQYKTHTIGLYRGDYETIPRPKTTPMSQNHGSMVTGKPNSVKRMMPFCMTDQYGSPMGLAIEA